MIIWTADNRIGVVLCQPDYPVLASNIQCLNELHFEFGVSAIFRNSFPNVIFYLSISDTAVVYSDGAVLIHGVDSFSLGASSFPEIWDDCLFIPCTQIAGNIDMRNSIRLFGECEAPIKGGGKESGDTEDRQHNSNEGSYFLWIHNFVMISVKSFDFSSIFCSFEQDFFLEEITKLK